MAEDSNSDARAAAPVVFLSSLAGAHEREHPEIIKAYVFPLDFLCTIQIHR